MVKEKQRREGIVVFVCEACGFGYLQREMAERCEDFCKSNGSCSLEITKHAISRGRS